MPQIKSTELDAFATMPQCLDNQFLPRPVLERVYAGTSTVRDETKARETAARREYVRSLLYSPEIIVNRAFAVNEPAVFEDVIKYPEAVATLIRNKRLTILLLRDETSLTGFMEDPRVVKDKRGVEAWRRFLSRYGEADQRFLRLSPAESEAITGRFPSFVDQLLRLRFTDERL